MKVFGQESPVAIKWQGVQGQDEVRTTWDPTPFVVKAQSVEFARKVLMRSLQSGGRQFENAPGVALRAMSDSALGTLTLSLRASDYVSGLLHQLPEHLFEIGELGDSARKVLDKCFNSCADGMLGDSPLPNRMGVNISVVSADNKLLVAKRSNKLAAYGGTFAPAVTGGIRPDKGDCDDVATIPHTAAHRQMKEEMGIEAGHGVLRWTLLIRDRSRLGKPDLFGRYQDGRSANEIIAAASNAVDKWEIDRIEVLDMDPQAIEQFVATHPIAPSHMMGFWDIHQSLLLT